MEAWDLNFVVLKRRWGGGWSKRRRHQLKNDGGEEEEGVFIYAVRKESEKRTLQLGDSASGREDEAKLGFVCVVTSRASHAHAPILSPLIFLSFKFNKIN